MIAYESSTYKKNEEEEAEKRFNTNNLDLSLKHLLELLVILYRKSYTSLS